MTSMNYKPHSLCKILKKLLQPIQSFWGWAIIGSKMVDLLQTSIFLGKIIIIFIYLMTDFIVPNFKKNWQ